jgi:hypothetical protein
LGLPREGCAALWGRVGMVSQSSCPLFPPFIFFP